MPREKPGFCYMYWNLLFIPFSTDSELAARTRFSCIHNKITDILSGPAHWDPRELTLVDSDFIEQTNWTEAKNGFVSRGLVRAHKPSLEKHNDTTQSEVSLFDVLPPCRSYQKNHKLYLDVVPEGDFTAYVIDRLANYKNRCEAND
jgi:hypothetical protein